jgi:hypothetical protein
LERSIFVAVPHYGGGVVAEALPGLSFPSMKHRVHLRTNSVSLLAFNFNSLWCQALNDRRKNQTTHFAMHHSDIGAPPGWVDTLLEEMDRVGADVLSAIVPMKDGKGLTSTAWYNPQASSVRRITLKEAHRLPVTFDAAANPEYGELLINTGLWICQFKEQWVERVCFTIADRIVQADDGTFQPRVFSEDWHFSHWCNLEGLRVFATRILPVAHYGAASFRNDSPWGDWDTDRGIHP